MEISKKLFRRLIVLIMYSEGYLSAKSHDSGDMIFWYKSGVIDRDYEKPFMDDYLTELGQKALLAAKSFMDNCGEWIEVNTNIQTLEEILPLDVVDDIEELMDIDEYFYDEKETKKRR